MPRFEFRLEKVLEYRALEESWAKDAYLDLRASRIEREVAIAQIQSHRKDLLRDTPWSIQAYQALEASVQKLDDEENMENSALQVLQDEEAASLEAWHAKKRELDVLQKLRDKAFEEWILNENRREQNELDEWSVLRRAA